MILTNENFASHAGIKTDAGGFLNQCNDLGAAHAATITINEFAKKKAHVADVKCLLYDPLLRLNDMKQRQAALVSTYHAVRHSRGVHKCFLAT